MTGLSRTGGVSRAKNRELKGQCKWVFRKAHYRRVRRDCYRGSEEPGTGGCGGHGTGGQGSLEGTSLKRGSGVHGTGG